MNLPKAKKLFFILVAVSVVLLSVIVVLLFDGRTGAKHVGGLVNIGLAVSFVHLIDLCDDRWTLYNQIIEERNLALAVAYAGWVIGATIAFPSSIL